MNLRAPPDRRVRVLLGDPPIDWSVVRTQAEHRTWIERRDSHAAEVIRREVIAKGRRALVLYGQGHLQRRNLLANYDSDGLAGTVVSLVESGGTTKAFTMWWLTDRKPIPAEVEAWRVPSVALRGSLTRPTPLAFR